MLAVAPSASDVGTPTQQIVVSAVSGADVTSANCASLSAASRALAERSADELATRLGGKGGVTVATLSYPHDRDRVVRDPMLDCRGGASVTTTVLRTAIIPIPDEPSERDRAAVTSTLGTTPSREPPLKIDARFPIVYAFSNVAGDDDRVAVRIAADRARRAARLAGFRSVGLAAIISPRVAGTDGTPQPPPRFFYPLPAAAVGVALEVARDTSLPWPASNPAVRVVPPDPYDVAAPVGSGELMRFVTVETSIHADNVVVTGFVSNMRSDQIIAVLRGAGIEAKATQEPILRPVIEGSYALVRPESVAVASAVRRFTDALPAGASVGENPHLESCDGIDETLIRGALAALEARAPLAISIGGLRVTRGYCGRQIYARPGGAFGGTYDVTARTTVGVWP